MINYLVVHKKTGKTMLFTYDVKGFLKAFKTDFTMTQAIVDFLTPIFPLTEADLKHFKDAAAFTVEAVKQDLSFKGFWELYNFKHGKKPRAESLWEALSDPQKAKALSYIAKYKNFLLLNPGTQTLYPETYLSQQRFNNE